jgi:putative ABC transport system permease protein
MNKLVFANLLHRPVRSIISVLAVAIEVVMILSIVAIFMGMLDDTKQRTNGIGADLFLWPSSASYMVGVGGAPLPVQIADVLRKLPHVEAVAPAITHLSTQGKVEVIYGIDFASFNSLKPFTFLAGGPFKGPNDVIIDDLQASSTPPLHVGDTITIIGRPFRVCGIVVRGKGGRKMIPLDTMSQLIGSAGKVSNFYIKVDNRANLDTVINEIHATPGLGDYPVQTIDDWLTSMTPDKLPGFNMALGVVTSIAVIVGFLVIFQSMYTAVLERTREIGILKSMGASKAAIIGVVLRETAVLAVIGVILGIAGTFAVQALMAHFFPTLNFEITLSWIVRAALIAFAGSICGALYPALMAARKDPIEALAYE